VTTVPHSDQIAQFAELVLQMRSAQKTYFTTRDRMVLAEAKTLEGRVDDQLFSILRTEAARKVLVMR